MGQGELGGTAFGGNRRFLRGAEARLPGSARRSCDSHTLWLGGRSSGVLASDGILNAGRENQRAAANHGSASINCCEICKIKRTLGTKRYNIYQC